MKNTLVVVELVFVSALVICFVWNHLTSPYTFGSTFMLITFGIPVLFDAAARCRRPKEDTDNRTVAMYLSLVPGLGHLYLRNRAKTILFSLMTCSWLMCGAVFMTKCTIYYEYAPLLFIALFVLCALSSLSVQRICDELGLPEDIEATRDLRIDPKYMDLGAFAVFVLFIIVLWTTSFLYLNDIMPADASPVPIYVIMGLSLLSLIPAVRSLQRHIRNKKECSRQSDGSENP